MRLNRRRPSRRKDLKGLWLAIASPSLAAEWGRYRLLTMVLTLALLVWTAIRVFDLALDAPDQVRDTSLTNEPGTEGATSAELSRRSPGSEGLRQDLFMVPRARKPGPPPAPKTNPVELLALIELQGILGGSNPRAMVMYKRTREAVTVSVGDDLGEFQVVDIHERSVVLKWREELFELSL